MKCPIDQIELNMSDRQGIEIDYCPQCRGVWLDRGELDKIIERSDNSSSAPSSSPVSRPSSYQEPHPSDRPSRDGYSDHYQRGHNKRKKENFLGDLFDF